jgi:hypothetical protein
MTKTTILASGQITPTDAPTHRRTDKSVRNENEN